MGDTNGVAISQATHEALLKSFGCLQGHQWLRYGAPPPMDSTWEGVYIDDHIWCIRIPKPCLRCTDVCSNTCVHCAVTVWRDVAIGQSATSGLELEGVRFSLDKRFRFDETFEA